MVLKRVDACFSWQKEGGEAEFFEVEKGALKNVRELDV